MGKIYASFILTKFSNNMVTQHGFLGFISAPGITGVPSVSVQHVTFGGYALCMRSVYYECIILNKM